MHLREAKFSSVLAAVGLASQRFAILPDESELGHGTIDYQHGSLHHQRLSVGFHVSEHDTVADLVQHIRRSRPFAAILHGLSTTATISSSSTVERSSNLQ